MGSLPELALSVRQPWSWAIIHAGKDIENRSWQAVNHGLKIRGRVCIHASKGITRSEYEDAREFMASIGVRCPPAADLLRGGIIGTVMINDVVNGSDSPWFFGPRGLVLSDPEPCEFVPAVGALGYFRWVGNRDIPLPLIARWMDEENPPAPKQPALFGED